MRRISFALAVATGLIGAAMAHASSAVTAGIEKAARGLVDSGGMGAPTNDQRRRRITAAAAKRASKKARNRQRHKRHISKTGTRRGRAAR